jgi:hypothetical protein
MNVKQIYNLYKIPPNLQKHMLRVTALSQLLIEKWEEIILDKDSITFACAFHDMANIIKYDFNKPPLFTEEENEIDYWKKIQTEMIKKYGDNVHLATLKICKEIGLSLKALRLIKNLEWNNTLKILKQHDFESAIPIYCDMRIGPYGIMSIKDRLINLQTRNNSFNFSFINKAAGLLEKTLQKHILLKVDSINDSQINERFDKILKLDVLKKY